MRSAWIMIMVLVGALAVALVAAESWRRRRELDLARAQIDRGEFLAALGRLESLAAARPRWPAGGDGAIDYWLGECCWRTGRREAALAAFLQVPEEGDYGTRAAARAARGLLDRGRWREAEERLERALSRGGPGLDEVRTELDQLYRMQGRFEDAARLLRDRCTESRDPASVIRALWRTERGTPPYQTIEQALAIGERLDAKEDRIWLGRARLATQTGRLSEAEQWLKRCSEVRADEPVWRAWLDWARAADRPETARNALRAIGPERLGPRVRLEWRAWFARRGGDSAAERRALADWLVLEPRNPIVISRLAALATRAGEADRAAGLQSIKAAIDRDLDAYNRRMTDTDSPASTADLVALGRQAESIGRPFDARIWYTLALRARPDDAESRAALAHLETAGRESADSL
ncbi:MAG: tetratricopeptide repeat protein, partial [Isosphaeraceae bacterium]